MRAMSNFSYKDARGQLTRIPVRYGDMNRQVAHIINQNSENTIPSAPFIACYIKNIEYDRSRLQDPTFVSKINVREQAFDENGNEYLNMQGANYTVERMMPAPHLITFSADFWSTNLDQKLQMWEQITVLFNPSLEIQTTDNYVDWTSLSVLERDSMIWSSRSIPQGVEQDVDIMTMSFKAPVWITPPAKVKKLGIITKIIANVFAVSQNAIEQEGAGITELIGEPDTRVVVTPGNFDLLVLNNVASLISPHGEEDDIDLYNPQLKTNWMRLLDLHPGIFRAGISQIRLTKPDGNEIVAQISLDPTDETRMLLNIDPDTVPSNTIISGRGTVDAIIDPETFNPSNKPAGTRYLILEDINPSSDAGEPGYDGPDAWKNSDNSDFVAGANDIIEWDGSMWNVVLDSSATTSTVYVTNSYTGVQYKWENGSWSKSFEGVYSKMMWRLIL